jgi:ADP-ribosylation factor family
MSFLWTSISRWWDSLLQSLGLFAGKRGHLILLGLDNSGKTTLLYRLQSCGDASIGQAVFPPTDRPTFTSNAFSYQGIQFTAWDLGGHEVVRHLWQDYVSSATSATSPAAPSSTSSSKTTGISAILFLIDASDSERLEEAAYELDHLIHETLLQENDDDDVDIADHAKNNVYSTTASRGIAIQDGQYDVDENDDARIVNGNGQHSTISQTTTSPYGRGGTSSRSSSRSTIPPIAILLNKCDLETAMSTDEICRRIELDALQKSISMSCRRRHPRQNGEKQQELAQEQRLQVFRVSVLQGQGYPQAFQWIASFL